MARLTPEEVKGLQEAYAKVYEQKNLQERPVSAAKQRWLDSQQSQKNLKDATKGYKFSRTDDGNIRADKVSGNNSGSTGGSTPVKTSTSTQSSGGSTGGSVKVDGKALMNKLRAGSSGGSTGGSGGTPVNKLFGRGGSDGSPAAYTGGPSAAQRANAPAPTGGAVKSAGAAAGQAAPAKKPGLLGRLGSLAGKAVSGARNVAGNVAGAARNVAGNVASGIKAGAKAVGSALANKGPIQGRASGPQRRAQQAQTRSGTPTGGAGAGGAVKSAGAAAKPAAAPLSNNSPAAKAGIPLNMRQQAAQKNAQFKADRASGALRGKTPSYNSGPSWTWDSYDPTQDLFDNTAEFLISEGHAKDKSEAISIMSEPEFIESFNEELYG